MNYFLDTQFSEKQSTLNAEESKHALRSLRLSIGDELIVGDGKGTRYKCSLAGVDDHMARLRVESKQCTEPSKNQLTIALAPTKNPSRFEWFLEKATEMGVWEVIPITCQHSERPRINEKRAQKILRAATKQSQRFFMPKLLPISNLKELNLSNYDKVLLAHCHLYYERVALTELLTGLSGKTLILIGPEGDFSRDEIEYFYSQDVQGISLGNNRLRTETAGVFSAAVYSALVK